MLVAFLLGLGLLVALIALAIAWAEQREEDAAAAPALTPWERDLQDRMARRERAMARAGISPPPLGHHRVGLDTENEAARRSNRRAA